SGHAPARGGHGDSCAGGAHQRHRTHGQGRGPPGEDPRGAGSRRSSGRMELHRGNPARHDVHRREPPVHGRPADRQDEDRVRAKPRQRNPTERRRPRPARLAPRAHVRRGAVRAARGLGGGDMTKDQGPNIDPALWRGLTQSRFSRRQMLKYTGMGAGAAGLAAFLAACGTKGALPAGNGSSPLPNTGIGTSAWWDKQTLNKQLEFATGLYNIDVPRGKPRPRDEYRKKPVTRADSGEFTKKKTAFSARISRSLSGGQPPGYNIIVIPNTPPPLGYLFEAGW